MRWRTRSPRCRDTARSCRRCARELDPTGAYSTRPRVPSLTRPPSETMALIRRWTGKSRTPGQVLFWARGPSSLPTHPEAILATVASARPIRIPLLTAFCTVTTLRHIETCLFGAEGPTRWAGGFPSLAEITPFLSQPFPLIFSYCQHSRYPASFGVTFILAASACGTTPIDQYHAVATHCRSSHRLYPFSFISYIWRMVGRGG